MSLVINIIPKIFFKGLLCLKNQPSYSECGTSLLNKIILTDDDENEISDKLLIKNSWKRSDYRSALIEVEKLEGNLNLSGGNLEGIKKHLDANRSFMLGLLENPNLLEHDRFTDLLWSVFHLTEELDARPELSGLPENDLKHLEIDIMRSYKLLVREWLSYMEKLQKDYPYLFSMAVRTNPMDKNADPVFR